MKINDSFCKRIAVARASLGLTQDKLAEMVGVVRRQIAAYEAGSSKPREAVLQNLAAALGTSTEWLAQGKGDGPNTSNVKRTVTVREIPLLTHTQALSGGVEFDDFLDGTSATDFIPAPPAASEYAFALRVQGDSMQSSGSPSFPDGSIIVVDPTITPEDGDFGIFVISGYEMGVFKQFVIDQGNGYLRSLNPQYPVIPVSIEPEAIGKVIASSQSFRESGVERYSSINTEEYAIREKAKNNIEARLTTIESKLDAILQLLTSNKKPT